MLDWMLGATMAVVVCLFALGIILRIMMACFGTIGTSLILLVIAVFAAYAGVLALIHSDNLALQLLGWAVAALTVWGTAKGAQIGIRKVREWWRDLPTNGTDDSAAAAMPATERPIVTARTPEERRMAEERVERAEEGHLKRKAAVE